MFVYCCWKMLVRIFCRGMDFLVKYGFFVVVQIFCAKYGFFGSSQIKFTFLFNSKNYCEKTVWSSLFFVISAVCFERNLQNKTNCGKQPIFTYMNEQNINPSGVNRFSIWSKLEAFRKQKYPGYDDDDNEDNDENG